MLDVRFGRVDRAEELAAPDDLQRTVRADPQAERVRARFIAGREIADKRPLERYVAESKRLLAVLDTRLEGRQWIMGDDYTIADIATLGWVNNLITLYEARELVAYDSFGNVGAWLDRALARPAVKRGLGIPGRG